MCLSGSQSETTSTGATWMRRHRSLLPYQPAPIKPDAKGPRLRSGEGAPRREAGSGGEEAAGFEEGAAVHRGTRDRGWFAQSIHDGWAMMRIFVAER